MDITPAFAVTGDHDSCDEDALVRAARADPVAFGELYKRHLDTVYRYLKSRAEGPEQAEDLAQQVFLQALRGLPRYRRDVPVRVWLLRIARNVAIDAHRRRRDTVSWDFLPERLHPVGPDGPDDLLLRRESGARLRALLLELSPDQRELIGLRFVGGLRFREIAAVVGKSPEAVRKQLGRTLQLLEDRYDER
jgi:RNA polymerase sigma-70 factor (ECF subfamily)